MQKINWLKISPVLAMVVFVILTQIITPFRTALDIDTSAYLLFQYLCSIYLLLFWFQSDRTQYDIQLPLDTGCLMVTVWPISVPIYLFKTRGLKAALRIIFTAIGVYVLSLLLGWSLYKIVMLSND